MKTSTRAAIYTILIFLVFAGAIVFMALYPEAFAFVAFIFMLSMVGYVLIFVLGRAIYEEIKMKLEARDAQKKNVK